MGHSLIFYENRRTPEVVKNGEKGKKGGAGTAAGKVVKRRPATAEEEKIISNGGWLRVNRDGKKPGQPGYMQRKSKVRPQNNSVDGMELSAESEPESESAVVVVALPAVDDPIWDVSSEDVPHLTVLYFGKNVAAGDIGWVKGVVKEAAQNMQPFTATVTSREPLGDEGADVLMLDPGKQMLDARSQMLSDHATKVMFDAVDQYPVWKPHLTLGYPDTPANGEPGDTIRFDRLSVWDGDYEGEEYPMGAGMTASTHWVPFAMTAAAGIAAPLEDLYDDDQVRIYLPLRNADASALTIDGVVGHNLSIPVINLGFRDDYTRDQVERAIDVVSDIALSFSEPLQADLGVEYGSTDGVLWTKPVMQGLSALRARLVSGLAQNNIKFNRALPDPVVAFANIGSNPLPDHLSDITPKRAMFDKLVIKVGTDTYSYTFGMLGSAMFASGLVVDGDLGALSDFSREDPNLGNGDGSRFRIPLLVPEGVPTGDGRRFKSGSLTTRDLPIPLMWQIKTSDGHDGSVVVGRVDTIDRISGGLGNAFGVFDTGPYGREAERMVRKKFLRGVSADLDQFEAVAEENELSDGDSDDAGGKKITAGTITVSKARVMGVTIVAKPAFQECTIELVDDEVAPQEKEPLVADGIYMDTLAPSDAEALVACAMVASHIPTNPPSKWFDNPMLKGPTPLTVDDDGRVFGHIAAWHVDHIGLPFGTRPPRSRSGYAYFHTGVVRTAESKDIPVGQLTLAGGHAGLELGAHDAVKHYDDTASAVADVHAGEDAYGIWVAGGLRPGTTPEQIRVLRASAPSGDWRPVQGRLELVAVCQVNVPGFPIARARVASGYVTALVAAGASAIAELRGATVEDRIAAIEREQRRDRAREDASLVASRFHRTAELTSPGVTTFRAYSKETLEEYAKKGWAHRKKDGCLSAETMVVTEHGVQRIDSILGAQRLLTDSGWVDAEVRSFGTQHLFDVLLERDGMLKVVSATLPHRWYLSDGRIVTTGNLGVDDEVPFVPSLVHSEDGLQRYDTRVAAGHHGDASAVSNVRGDASVGEVRVAAEVRALPHEMHRLRSTDGAISEMGTVIRHNGDASDVSGVLALASAVGVLQTRDAVPQRVQGLHEDAGSRVGRGAQGRPGQEAVSSRIILHAEVRDHVGGLGSDVRVAARDVRTVQDTAGGRDTTRGPLSRLWRGAWDSVRSVQHELGLAGARWTGSDDSVPGWRVVAVVDSGRDDEVFCAVVPGLNRFVLADGVLTGNSISYPIADVADLRRAIRAYGRASKEDKPAIRKHIMRRARGLDRPDLIPEQWMTAASTAARMELARTNPDMELVADGAFAMTASLRYRRPVEFEEELHPRDEHGKFRAVLGRIEEGLGGKTGTKAAMDLAREAREADLAGDDKRAQERAKHLIEELDKIADNTADLQDQEDLRANSRVLGEVMARLPMSQGNKDMKMRFSDLPVPLRDLVEDLLDRLSAAVTKEVFDEVAGPMKSYISGGDFMSSDEIQSHLTRIMRYLI